MRTGLIVAAGCDTVAALSAGLSEVSNVTKEEVSHAYLRS